MKSVHNREQTRKRREKFRKTITDNNDGKIMTLVVVPPEKELPQLIHQKTSAL